MPLKGDTPTNNIKKRLVYERYCALHALRTHEDSKENQQSSSETRKDAG